VSYLRRDGSTLTVPFAEVLQLEDCAVARQLFFIDNSALFACSCNRACGRLS
jgi:hypothetical protein